MSAGLLLLGCEDVSENLPQEEGVPLEVVAPEDEFEVSIDDFDPAEFEITEKSCILRNDFVTEANLSSGYWGTWETCPSQCPDGSYAYGITVRSEPTQGSGDDTALNGVRLYCFNRSDGRYRGYVDSNIGYWGNWGSYAHCSTYTTSNPFRSGIMKLEPPQGGGDDTATNRVYAYCIDGDLAAPSAYTAWGNWQTRAYCPSGTAVCGIRTRVEAPIGSGDDTALNGVLFACCEF
jgi:hypothetical protein